MAAGVIPANLSGIFPELIDGYGILIGCRMPRFET
jgi:hypothetical protein